MKYLLFFVLFGFCNFENKAQDITKHVNLFIGTTNEGNTVPGATMPFGMVQLSPDTRITKPSGYDYKDSMIIGFSHTHLSGTGLGDLGDVLTTPVSLSKSDFSKSFPDFTSAFSHAKETASPGYYSVFLNKQKTTVHLTATERCGFQKYEFSQNASEQGVFIDLQHSIYGLPDMWISDNVYECQLNIEDDYTISGYKKSKGWAPQQTVYFVMKFNKPIANQFIKDKNSISENVKFKTDSSIQAVFLFNSIHEILIKTGISATSIEGARKNLTTEIPDWDFENCKQKADQIWNSYLEKIEVEGSNLQKETFYSALYHTLVTPNLISDVDSTFFGPDFKNNKSKYGNYYSTFSLWDTYRAVHPLYTLICPDKNAEFANSMLEHFEIAGRLPIWTLWGTENYCMNGNHAISVIVDAILKGEKNIDTDLAWKAIYTSSTNLYPRFDFDINKQYGFTPSYWGEYGSRGDKNRFDWIDKYGYLPHDSTRESGTSLLELCYNDWCVAQLAQKLGKTDAYAFFQKRSGYCKNIFDKQTGFIRPRLSDGSWQTPFDPLAISDWKTSAFVEGNAAQYTFYVPHQIDTLIALCGGNKNFENKLDFLFTTKANEENFSGAVSGFMGQYAHGNEPSHHIAYLYNSIGKQHRTAEKVTEILKTQYGNSPTGLCGNDDCGQMSAWYVFSTLGFYPVNPANSVYAIGTPTFKSAVINLPNGTSIKISAQNVSDKNVYIQSAKLDNVPYEKAYITHNDIIKGGHLEFVMGKQPNKKWGAAAGDAPPNKGY